jgi:hypothetical protein
MGRARFHTTSTRSGQPPRLLYFPLSGQSAQLSSMKTSTPVQSPQSAAPCAGDRRADPALVFQCFQPCVPQPQGYLQDCRAQPMHGECAVHRFWAISHLLYCIERLSHKRRTTNVITALTSRVCRMYRASIPVLRPRKFITRVGGSSAAPRTRAPQPIYAFISPLTKASRSAFTFSGSVIAIP